MKLFKEDHVGYSFQRSEDRTNTDAAWLRLAKLLQDRWGWFDAVLTSTDAVPGKHFSDELAAHLLEVLGEIYELQLDVDRMANSHLPINFTRVDDVLTALTIRRVAKVAAETNDHALDEHALRATKILMEAK